MPLHIFEPRYRRMLADVLAGDRRFGILFTPEGTAERAHEAGAVGCTAVVTEATQLEDGRSNIVVRGEDRFVLDRLVDSAMPYLMAQTVAYGDAPEPEAACSALADRVRDLFTRVARAAHTIDDERAVPPVLPDDPTLLAFAIAAMIDLDGPARQRLLESRSPTDRLRVVEALLGRATAPLERRATVHIRAKSNGAGPHGGA